MTDRNALIGMTRADVIAVTGTRPSSVGTTVGKLGLGIRDGIVYDATAERAARDALIEARRVDSSCCDRCGARRAYGCEHHASPVLVTA